jgi:hypothetical protein
MLTISIYVLLGLAIALVEGVRFYRRRSIDALTFFGFYYFLLFVLAPINVLIYGDSVVRQKHAYHTFGPGDEVTALCILTCYALFLIGYQLNPEIGRQRMRLSGEGNCYSVKTAARISVVYFVIGAAAMSYNVVEVGGFLDVVRQAPFIRSGVFAFEGKFVFIRQFIAFLSAAFLLYLAVCLRKTVSNQGVTAGDKAIMVVMGIALFYYALGTGGRREFLYPVLLYFLLASAIGRRVGVRIVVVAVLIVAAAASSLAVTGLLALDEMFRYQEEILDLVYLNTVQGIADSYIHFVGMQRADLWQFGFMRDIVELPLQMLPSRVFEIDRGRGVFGETSQFFRGEQLADNLSGEEPPGLHGYLLVNFGYVGLFVMFCLLGVAYRWLHNVFKPANSKDAIAWLIYWWVFFGFFVVFREGVVALAIKQHASWWLAIILLMLSRRRASGLGSPAIAGQSARRPANVPTHRAVNQ